MLVAVESKRLTPLLQIGLRRLVRPSLWRAREYRGSLDAIRAERAGVY